MSDLLPSCINVAVAEVNGMADFGVKVEPVRKGGKLRGKVTGFRVSWWRKNAEELKEAYKEIRQPKVGRIARLTGKVENMAPTCPRWRRERPSVNWTPWWKPRFMKCWSEWGQRNVRELSLNRYRRDIVKISA
jgi:hypothetical protein